MVIRFLISVTFLIAAAQEHNHLALLAFFQFNSFMSEILEQLKK